MEHPLPDCFRLQILPELKKKPNKKYKIKLKKHPSPPKKKKKTKKKTKKQKKNNKQNTHPLAD